jgi:hypothetical protein
MRKQGETLWVVAWQRDRLIDFKPIWYTLRANAKDQADIMDDLFPEDHHFVLEMACPPGYVVKQDRSTTPVTGYLMKVQRDPGTKYRTTREVEP